jgi:hypothetical protein
MGFRMGKKIKESSTTAGVIAPVAQSMHTDKRSVVGQGIYGKTKGGNLLTGKKITVFVDIAVRRRSPKRLNLQWIAPPVACRYTQEFHLQSWC